MKNRPIVMSPGDAARFLGISWTRFDVLVKKYDIPFQQTSACKIFFKEDLITFQESRKDKMKHRRK